MSLRLPQLTAVLCGMLAAGHVHAQTFDALSPLQIAREGAGGLSFGLGVTYAPESGRYADDALTLSTAQHALTASARLRYNLTDTLTLGVSQPLTYALSQLHVVNGAEGQAEGKSSGRFGLLAPTLLLNVHADRSPYATLELGSRPPLFGSAWGAHIEGTLSLLHDPALLSVSLGADWDEREGTDISVSLAGSLLLNDFVTLSSSVGQTWLLREVAEPITSLGFATTYDLGPRDTVTAAVTLTRRQESWSVTLGLNTVWRR